MPYHSRRAFALIVLAYLVLGPPNGPGAGAEEYVPAAQASLTDRLPSFPDVIGGVAAQLASLSDWSGALALFKTAVGPRLGLHDAAMAVGAKNLSPTMLKDLFMPDLTRSAGELMRGLAAWQLTEAVDRLHAAAAPERVEEIQRQIQTQMAWFSEGTGLEPSLRQLLTLSQRIRSPEIHSDPTAEPLAQTALRAELAGVAAPVQNWAIQTTHREWVRLYSWKDQVRQQRGLTRLCGTWQWSIHNHQNHREEKTAVIFAPSGTGSAVGPAEIVVIGDTVYLRWETSAGVQEDSLLFSAEGQRLEGTFVNTAGGWGSITGKRTASCATKEGTPPVAGPRRRH